MSLVTDVSPAHEPGTIAQRQQAVVNSAGPFPIKRRHSPSSCPVLGRHPVLGRYSAWPEPRNLRQEWV